MSLLVPLISSQPAEALRAIARKMDRREVRSFYIVIVDSKGGARNSLHLDPDFGNVDVNIIGNNAVDLCEKLGEFVASKQRIHSKL